MNGASSPRNGAVFILILMPTERVPKETVPLGLVSRIVAERRQDRKENTRRAKEPKKN